MAAMVIDPSAFRSASDFAASLGLVPRQDGTGGKVKLGPISKRGNGYLRRMLVSGAMALLMSKRAKQDPWLVRLLATKPRKLVAVALANKMARIGWALMSQLIAYARSAGLGEIFGHVIRENTTMIEMCRGLGFIIAADPEDSTLVLATLELGRQ